MANGALTVKLVGFLTGTKPSPSPRKTTLDGSITRKVKGDPEKRVTGRNLCKALASQTPKQSN